MLSPTFQDVSVPQSVCRNVASKADPNRHDRTFEPVRIGDVLVELAARYGLADEPAALGGRPTAVCGKLRLPAPTFELPAAGLVAAMA